MFEIWKKKKESESEKVNWLILKIVIDHWPITNVDTLKNINQLELIVTGTVTDVPQKFPHP